MPPGSQPNSTPSVVPSVAKDVSFFFALVGCLNQRTILSGEYWQVKSKGQALESLPC